MNIFYLDDDPALAAQQHCDRHVVKMILETAQILSTVWHKLAPDSVIMDWRVSADHPYGEIKHLHVELCGNRIYKPTHINHPAVEWACTYGGNYLWLYRLGMYLLEEYTYRYGRIHACTPVMRALELLPPPLASTESTYCDGFIIMPNEYAADDVISSYRNYYRVAKENLLTYTRRQPPEWLSDIAHFKGERA